jgi:hypothetical protein
MGGSGMGGKLSEFVKCEYPDSKSDASTAFMEQALSLCKTSGYMTMINIPVWMFLSSYERLRKKLLRNNTITNMIHFGRGIFGSDFGTTAFIISKTNITDYIGAYRRLFEKQGSVDSVEQKEKWFFEGMGTYAANSANFAKIPGSPVAYWVSVAMLRVFTDGAKLGKINKARRGLETGDNVRFMRNWYELSFCDIIFTITSSSKCPMEVRWVPHNKGGEGRKWYGNNDLVVWFHNRGQDLLGAKNGFDYYFQPGITWTALTSATNTFRLTDTGFTFDSNKGPLLPDLQDGNVHYLLGFLNSSICHRITKILNPSLSLQNGDVNNIPVFLDLIPKEAVDALVTANIALSRTDWDAFETSWDFKRHPLLNSIHSLSGVQIADKIDWDELSYLVKGSYMAWEYIAQARWDTLKANEEELNRIFIDIYGLQDELTPEVDDKDVTVRRADLGREIRSLVSYAVGCMFGRYSLDAEGLAYAGGEWDIGKYKTFIPDGDNVLPICDDEYFDDDICGRFVDFVRTVYGADTLEENLRFIADALGGSGTPREVIRKYFMNDFFKDHCKIYQKRPIYWLFDSGKKNGFKALMYLHRYSRDLLAKLRTDYVHEQQERYRTQLNHTMDALNTATGPERAQLLKQQEKFTAQSAEIAAFEEKLHHLADMNIEIDLDDGVKRNYERFADVLAKI